MFKKLRQISLLRIAVTSLGRPLLSLTMASCVFADASVREESDNDQNQSDEAEAEASPTKSPTTPKNVKCKNSSGSIHSVPDARAMSLSLGDMKQEHLHPMLTGHLHPPSTPKAGFINGTKWQPSSATLFHRYQLYGSLFFITVEWRKRGVHDPGVHSLLDSIVLVTEIC